MDCYVCLDPWRSCTGWLGVQGSPSSGAPWLLLLWRLPQPALRRLPSKCNTTCVLMKVNLCCSCSVWKAHVSAFLGLLRPLRCGCFCALDATHAMCCAQLFWSDSIASLTYWICGYALDRLDRNAHQCGVRFCRPSTLWSSLQLSLRLHSRL
jgi:hypothetical protein